MARNPWDDEQLDQEALLQQLGSGAPKPASSQPNSTFTNPSTIVNKGAVSKPASLGPVSGDVARGGGPASTTMPVGGAPQVTPEAAPTRTPTAASVFQGFTPRHAMEGFDFGREQNTGKSAKDAFAYLANQAPPPPINDKAALGAWFTQYIQPGMNELGHNVLSVDGDKFRFRNWQGEYDVDFGRGAGAEGGALAWQADDVNGVPQAQGTYAPSGGGAPVPGPAASPTQAPDDAPAADDPMAAIMAEIEALQNGGASPIDQQALMQLLGAV